LWLETLTELDGAPFRLEPFQVRWLNDRSRSRIVNKSRQLGFSTILAGEVLAYGSVRSGYRANIVSINQDEANDKVTIASNLYHSIPDELDEAHLGSEALKPVLYINAANKIGFHRPPNTSEIVSQPASSAVRGGRKDIYFDEAAHIRDFAKLYQAAYPATIRGEGRMTIISTPLGQSGLFYDICTDVEAYPHYSRHAVPWWESRYMVKEGWVEEAIALAPGLDTKTRVARYGNPSINEILDGFGTDIIGFQTEFEAMFVDETTAYFPWSLIYDRVDDTLKLWHYIPPSWDPEGYISIGVDLAKARDETVFTVVEHVEPADPLSEEPVKRYVRYVQNTQAPYAEQFDDLKKLVKASRATRVTIDQTGVGQYFVERAQSEGLGEDVRVEGVVFTNQRKEAWATRFKGDLQAESIHLLRHPDLLRQIHAIQRTKSEAGYYKFAGKKDDFFWSLMLGLYGEGRTPPRMSSL
jgi:phage FluMu gp28-like protein